jgi:hypothetical protein
LLDHRHVRLRPAHLSDGAKEVLAYARHNTKPERFELRGVLDARARLARFDDDATVRVARRGGAWRLRRRVF